MRYGKPKYNNKKIEKYGHKFDSLLECAIFEMLAVWQETGEISDLKHHPGTIHLTQARIGFRPDFSWTNVKDGTTVWGEAKGKETDVYKIKKKLWAFYGPGILLVWTGKHSAFKLTETLIPMKH